MKFSEKKLSVRSLILITLLLSVMVIVICSGAIVLIAKDAEAQIIFDVDNQNEKALPVLVTPDTAVNAYSMSEKTVKEAIDSDIVKYKGETKTIINSISCDNKNIENIIKHMSPTFELKFNELFDVNEIKYGENASELKKLLPNSKPDSFETETKDDKISIKLKYDSIFKNMYFLGDDKKAINTFIQDNTSVFDAVGIKMLPSAIIYTFSADIYTGRLISINVERGYDISFNAFFKNSLSELGNTNVLMKVSFNDIYNILFAGISIEQNQIILAKNGYDALSLKVNTEENLSDEEYNLVFSSSNESIVSVDEKGQIEAVELSPQPVEVAVTLTYLDKTFTDTCIVYCINEAETIKISEQELTLNIGDKKTLTAEIKPKNATLTQISWHSSNEAVATVSSNGEISALSEGSAVITGYILPECIGMECIVTVTK